MCIIKYTHPTHEFQNLEQKTETSEVISRCQPGFRTLLQADRTSARSTQRSPGSTRFKIKQHRSLLGMVSRKKVAVLLDFVQITSPPLPPIWTTCTTFFERQKLRFKRRSKWLNKILMALFYVAFFLLSLFPRSIALWIDFCLGTTSHILDVVFVGTVHLENKDNVSKLQCHPFL